MKQCPKCGAELPDDARFCMQCGVPQEGAPGTQAQVEGSGAIAQGEGTTAAGERGVAVGGDVGGEVRVLFGESTIPPTLYQCPNHGDVLAQDVVWKQDGRPYCPECDALLDSDRD